jgi:hypothetical protein
MFMGHYAVAFAAKRAAPEVRLGILVMAVQWLDLLWPAFLLIGVEHASVEPHATRVTPLNFYDYPWSHSLLMTLLWSVAFAGLYCLAHRTFTHTQRSTRVATVLGFCVFSHWLLDWIAHRADMPLWPGHSPLVGLGLWNHPAASFAVEFCGFAIALALYWPVAKRSVRPVALCTLLALLLLIGASSYFSHTVPPSITPVMWSAFAQWLLVALAYAAERGTES